MKEICIEIKVNYPVLRSYGHLFGNEIIDKEYEYQIYDKGVIVSFLKKDGKLVKTDLSNEKCDYYDYFIN